MSIAPRGVARGALVLATLSLALTSGQATAQAPAPPARVMVQPGETLSEIALRYYGIAGAATSIAAANGLSDPDRIRWGTELILPPPGSVGTAAAVPTTAPAATATSAAGRTITVAAGETLSTIALRTYGAAEYAASLAKANGITDPDQVRAGVDIVLPASLRAPAGVDAATRTVPAVSTGTLAGRRICLDAGHGGIDPGAIFALESGQLLRESEIALDITTTLAQRLRAQGAAVTLTRQTDILLDMPDRAARCNASGAEVTVSLHLNGFAERSVNGALALYGKPAEQALAELMASRMQAGLFGGRGDAVAFGARKFESRLLSYTAMPAVIVEPAFLTNPAEARALATPAAVPGSRRDQIAREVERGILAYLR